MRTLLIVDDEMLIANGLRDMISKAFDGRLRVLCCYSSATALETAGQEAIDMLLTDINMPGITGLELHRLIREKHPGCRVIYLTGYSDFEYARTALEQQAFAFLLKGEGDDVVVQTLERAIQKIDEEGRVPETEPEANAESKSRIELVQEYIASHLNEDLSLNRLSEVCHFHPVYLSRVFKEALGVTVGEYINLARLKKAKDLLVNSQMTVLEISREMGFTTDNYFCRWFRKSTGMSPHHYRDGNRN